MKILYLITCADRGGAQVNVLSLAREAAARGHSVRIAVGETGWLTERTAECGGKTVILRGLRRSWNPLLVPRFIFALRHELQREPADIVHLHSSNVIFGVLAAKTVKHPPKLIATVHGLSVSSPGWRQNYAVQSVYTAAMRLLWSLCDRLVFVCQNDFDLATERRWVKAEKCSVITNGIDDRIEFLSRKQAREGLGLAADDRRPVIGTVARLEYSKDMDLFLRVAKEMRGSGAVFQIIGDGPDRQKLRDAVERFGLTDSVRIRTQPHDGRKYMPAFDVFLMTSRYEGLPYALLEAGLAGLPAVSTDVGGVSEIISDGATGLLVRGRDAVTLADALKCLLGNPARREAMGSAASRRIRSEFTEQKMAERTFALYERAFSTR